MVKALDAFFRAFRGVRDWQQRRAEQLLRTRKIVSPTGRVRTWLGYITRRVKQPGGTFTIELIDKIKKEGWAFEPQDMEGWVLALGLDNVKTNGAGLIEPLAHVHDELVMQIPESPGRLVDEALEIIGTSMTITQWGMEFPADVGQPSPNWRCAKDTHDFVRDACRDCGIVKEGE